MTSSIANKSMNLGIFLMPFQSLVIPISSSLYFYQFFLFAAIVLSNRTKSFSLRKSDIFAILYVAIASLLCLLSLVGDSVFADADQRLLSLALIIATFVSISVLFNNSNVDPVRAFRWGLAGLTIACLLGLMQLIVFYYFSIDIFPINFINSQLLGQNGISAAYVMGDNHYFRPNGLSGEPKTYGMYCALLFIFAAIPATPLNGFRRAFLMTISALGVFYSASTSALFLLGLGLAIFALVLVKIRIKPEIFIILLTISSLFVLLQIFGTTELTYLEYDPESVASARGVEGYLTTRLLGRIGLEDFDYLASTVFREHFILTLFGGAGLFLHWLVSADELAKTWVPVAMIFSPKSGLLFVISHVGLVGLLVYIYSAFIALRKVDNMLYYPKGRLIYLFMFIILAFLLRSYLIFACYFYWTILERMACSDSMCTRKLQLVDK